jgi:Domain of unknown function (DUF4114)
MKKIILSLMMVLILNIGCGSAFAALTDILPGNEVALSSILDHLYGLGNLQRVDDSIEQLWLNNGDTSNVIAMAKYAGYTQELGYMQNDVFHSLVAVTGTGYAVTGSAQFTVTNTAGDPFAFADRTNGLVWSSFVSANVDGKDHMVTYEIVDPQSAVSRYVIAFEDYNRLGDQDYNDLVVEVDGVTPNNPVPEPMTMLLFGPAFLGLVGLKKKKS